MIGWVDCASGASGDMLLGAVLAAGADADTVAAAVAAVAPESTDITTDPVVRGTVAAWRAVVTVSDSRTHRGLADVLGLIEAAALADEVGAHAAAVFTRLAEAEAQVHGTTTAEVQFHEVGALDAIADVIGVCAGLVDLRLDRLHGSPVAVGTGTVSTSHGAMSVPPPAVVLLLRGIPSYAGPAATELCTPTGAALLSHWVSTWGPQPAMSVERVGIGAGSKEFASHANVVRLLVGEAYDAETASPRPDSRPIVYETNVDDLDPRLWPGVLAGLFDAGAADAWLTPIVMKKGRPAHTLSVLVSPDRADTVRAVIFGQTSALGMRETRVSKHALDREFEQVQVGGQPISVKVAWLDGVVVNVQPEYEHVAAAAAALGRPAKEVLAEATAAAAPLWQRPDRAHR